MITLGLSPTKLLGEIILHLYELKLIGDSCNEKITIKLSRTNKLWKIAEYICNEFDITLNDTVGKTNLLSREYVDQLNKNRVGCSLNTSFEFINELVNSLGMSTYADNWECRKNIESNDIGISIKYLYPYREEESNAKIEVWVEAIERILKMDKERKIRLIGDDSQILKEYISNNRIEGCKNVVESLDASTKVSAIIGCASGMLTLSKLSSVPYRIFKSPAHHKDEMKKELIGNTLRFSSENQKIICEQVTTEKILKEYIEVC